MRVARADWEPRGIAPTSAALNDVLAAQARVARGDDPALAERHERWTYVAGTHALAVDVNVRGDDFRTSLDLDGLTYMAGRLHGARWRADGNGIVHGVQADLQGDALDRAPQAIFRLDPASCTLAGEARLPAPAWVIATHRLGDKPAFLYVDEATATIVREVMRDGKRVITTTFDRFEPIDGALRARHWHVDDGDRANALDVTVDAIEPGAVGLDEVGFPARRAFSAATPLARSVDLNAVFNRGMVLVRANVDGTGRWFLLDTGTTSITVAPGVARRSGGIVLEHATLGRMSVGPLQLDRVSVLSIPALSLTGILGLDFFFGHTIEIDYRHEHVRVLSADDARRAFADPATTSVPANVDQGLPLVTAGFGAARSDDFAVDTGSPRLYVMRPFATRFADEIKTHWTPVGERFVQTYLEGGIEIQPYHVARFDLGSIGFEDVDVGAQIPTRRTDDLAVPFDGIIGTDVLRLFDLFIDYDNARIGFRRDAP